MVRLPKISALIPVLSAGLLLASCTSVSLPEVRFMEESTFEEDVAALETSYPRIDDTPAMPGELRTAEDWDVAARDMLSLFDGTDVPPGEPSLSDAEFEERFRAAQAATSEYKKDDPQ